MIETLTRLNLIKLQIRDTFEHHGHLDWFDITNEDQLLLEQLISLLEPILQVSKRCEGRECSLWKGQLQLDYLMELFNSIPENCDELISTLRQAINHYVKKTSDMALVSVYLVEGKSPLSIETIQQVCLKILHKLGKTEEEKSESNGLSVTEPCDYQENDDNQCLYLSVDAYISKRLAQNPFEKSREHCIAGRVISA